MRAKVIAGIVVTGLSAVLAAGAAAQWSSPQTLSRPHSYVLMLGSVGYTTTGAAVAAWNWQDGVGNDSTTGWSMVSRPPAGGAFAGERELPAGVVSGPEPYGAGRLVVATQTFGRGGSALSVRFGDLSGRFGRPQLIARRPQAIRGTQLAVNARGAAVLAWREYRGAGRDRIYASVRRRGRAFGPAVLLGKGRIRAISAAIGPAGDVLVAWDARGRIRTRLQTRSARAFGAVDQLRSRTTFHAALQTAIAPGGRAWVAWTSQLLTEGGDRGDAYIQLARRAPGARSFEPALLLRHAPASSVPSPVSLAIGPGGAAALAWTMWDVRPAPQPTSTTVFAAHVRATGAASVGELDGFDAIEPADAAVAAYGEDGNALVAWTRRVVVLTSEPQPRLASDTTRAHASVRPPGGDWGPAQLVSAGPHVFGLTPTFAPGGGPPLLLFGNRPGALQSTVVQATTLAGPG